MPRSNSPCIIFFLAGLLGLYVPLFGEPGASTELVLQSSSRPEAKLSLSQSFTFPFLRGEGPLTQGNGIKAALTGAVSPVSLGGIAEITWTPIAFLQLTAGGRLDSGWNMALGNGIGINAPVDKNAPEPRKAEVSGTAFEGLFWGVHGGGAFQFDLAAIFPGDWNHLVFRTYHEGRYRAYTGASAEESWVFENDDGENRNGFSYYGNYLLGYQLPASPFLNMIGFLAEMDQYLYGSTGGELWGDALPRWYFGTLFSFTVTERIGAALLVQIRTLRNYDSADLENKEGLYYQDRKLVTGDPYRLVFYRAAAIFTFKLR